MKEIRYKFLIKSAILKHKRGYSEAKKFNGFYLQHPEEIKVKEISNKQENPKIKEFPEDEVKIKYN